MSDMNVNTENNTLRIAILDTGIKQDHPAVVGKQVEAMNVYASDKVSMSTKDTNDTYGHGTAIYNIYRNALPDSHITCFKVQEAEENEDAELLIETLKYIYEQKHYDVINISLGTKSNDIHLRDICEKICKKGTIIVSAFDNNGAYSYPAAYPFTIGVNSSESCRTTTTIEFVESDVINILANGNYQRLCWSKPDYIFLQGNSFACAHVGAIIAKLKLEGLNSLNNILSALKRISKKVHTVNIRNPEKVSLNLKISKAAIIPFNKEMHSLIRFNDLLNFDIVDVYDFKQSSKVGAEIKQLLKAEDLMFDKAIKNIDNIEWDAFDTLIIGHLNYYATLLNDTKLQSKLIDSALANGKQVFAFDENKDFEKNKMVYSPVVKSNALPNSYFGKLHTLNKPIVGVFGTSSKQGKYTLQLYLRKELIRRGYQVGQIGTEPTAELFGFTSFPIGYNSSVYLNQLETIVYINNLLNEMFENGSDLAIVGSQSNAIPYDFSNLSYLPLKQMTFLIATQPDAVLLCVNPYDSDEYIERTILSIENIVGCKVIALVLFPMKLRDNFAGIYSSKIKVTDDEWRDIRDRLINRFGRSVHILGENSIPKIADEIIDYLSS
jgi:uncharacterized NAD-dependent epimerase/dehydratase family protein